MLAHVKVDTPADEENVTWHLQKVVEFVNVPIPVVGDEIFVDGVIMDIRKRAITPQPKDAHGEPRIELFASIDNDSFAELEEKGWRGDNV